MNIKISEVAQDFYNFSLYMRGYSPKTIQRYKRCINTLKRDSGDLLLNDCSEATMRSHMLNGRVNRKWEPATFRTHFFSLKVFFDWCKKQNYIKENPMIEIELPKLEKKLPKRLTKQEATRILEVSKNIKYKFKFQRYRNYAVFSTFIFTGLRKSELLNLRFTDIDVENMTVFVRQGKGSKDRIVPFSQTLREIYLEYLKERDKIKSNCTHFFVSMNDDKPFNASGLRKIKRRIQKVSKIKFNIHALRHTFATLMLEGGCDIFSLSRMMGHSDIKTTTIYLAATTEHLREEAVKHPLNGIMRL